MTTLRSLRSFALTSITALSMLSGQAAHGASQDKPFRATLTTQETLGFSPAACPLTGVQGTSRGQGNATHLGHVTLVSTDCVAGGGSQYNFTGGKLTLVAANGDELFADYSGSLMASASPGSYALSGSYRVTGGTGRFSAATGSGSLQGTMDLGTGHGEYVASGTISY